MSYATRMAYALGNMARTGPRRDRDRFLVFSLPPYFTGGTRVPATFALHYPLLVATSMFASAAIPSAVAMTYSAPPPSGAAPPSRPGLCGLGHPRRGVRDGDRGRDVVNFAATRHAIGVVSGPMATEFNGKIRTTYGVPSRIGSIRRSHGAEDAPRMLYLCGRTGIATWDCFGGLVEMPAMSRIAERGVRLSQFHTTALCSPAPGLAADRTQRYYRPERPPSRSSPTASRTATGASRTTPHCCWRRSPRTATTPTASANGT